MDYVRALKWLPDKPYLQLIYYYHFHRFANLRHPRTFNEKLQWLKLYDRRPEYITMVDKYAVKEYVASKIGEEFIIPTLGVWNKPEEIDFDSLPNQFVLKWNHDSKSVVICSDKSSFDPETAKRKLRHGAEVNGYWYGREWPYKGVKPRIIAEKYLEQDNPEHQDLTDYKFFCFNGEPKFIQVIQDRSTLETIDFFDLDWKHQEFIGLSKKAVSATKLPQRPTNLDEMIKVASELSKGIPFSRIDLYNVDSHVYFGEVTLYPASGLGSFHPDEWNLRIGEMINLPECSGLGYKVHVINGLIRAKRGVFSDRLQVYVL